MAMILRTILLFCFWEISETAISIGGIPRKINVGEKEYETRKIVTLSVTATSFLFTCSVLSVVPTPNRNETSFVALEDPETRAYGIIVQNSDPGGTTPNVMFDYLVDTKFVVNVRCQNSDLTESQDSYLEVAIIPNDAIRYLNFVDEITVIARNVKSGDTIQNITAIDDLNHPLTFTMTSDPATTSFLIETSGTSTGRIYASQDLIKELNPTINLYVYATDQIISIEKKVRVDILNVNKLANITNLPATITVDENITSTTPIFTLNIYDEDVIDSHNVSLTISPVTEGDKFTYDSTNKQIILSSGSSLDFETTSSYTLTMYVTDGYHETGPYILTVNIRDINEACFFDNTLYTVSTNEGNVNEGLMTPGFTVSDLDGTSTYSLSFVNSTCNQLFNMASQNGEIRFRVNYDVDGGAYATNVECQVKCTDSGGLTGNTIVAMTILDINDNAPVFELPFYRVVVNQVSTLPIITFLVTDADSGDNADISCSGALESATSGTGSYLITSGCAAYFYSNTGLSSGDEQRYRITATDGTGSTAKSSTATVLFVYEEITTTTVTTTTTTTTQAPSTLTDGEIAAIVLGSLLGAALLGVLLYFCIRWCYTGAMCGNHPCDFTRCCSENCCRPRYDDYPSRETREPKTPRETRSSPREPRKETRVVRRERDTADEIKYWREDSDYGLMRSNKEEPYNWRPTGRREYPDFPYDGSQKERLSPSHVPLEIGSRGYGRVAPLETPLAVTYY